ncbi:MAG: ferrous iron transport protein B [Bacteroidetes bacterium]|nr:MAG: ferrous iron transport protein B [Bacteroidota bacterium]
MSLIKKVALLGNPNTGKTSVFNRLTGFNQQVGNFPGVTVDLKRGDLKGHKGEIQIIDFPGTYSYFPQSEDERVVYEVLSNNEHELFPDLAIVVVDSCNLERNLLLFTQIYDLGIPCILLLNMWDVAHRKGIEIDLEKLQEHFPAAKLCTSNARVGLGISQLTDNIVEHTSRNDADVDKPEKHSVPDNDVEKRYQQIRDILDTTMRVKQADQKIQRNWLDRISTHPVWGYAVFALIMLLIFQLIFSIASLPMDLIDEGFSFLSSWTSEQLPAGVFNDLISGGIIPGLGGVLVFLPQILILFFCLGILEESGYLARAVFMMDRLMRPFGLHGKSVVPLISSVACAIPGVMATRTIPNWKERLTTIMVAPLMSCSARIPVYTLLIALVIPRTYLLGFINVQGLVLFGLYLLGIIAALAFAFLFSKILKTGEKSFLLMEIPEFKAPRWGNLFINLFEKARIFVLEAGKVILIISILLWALASYGPPGKMDQAIAQVENQKAKLTEEQYQKQLESAKLESSYIGMIGKGVEPIIRPLGLDWKMGIALITSFAAREVFVGSMATIYSVHEENSPGLIAKMRSERYPDGTPVYTLASGLSLMIFYVFAMQCMATLAVVKRETKSWKWPLIQLTYMGVLAYLSSLITYQILS